MNVPRRDKMDRNGFKAMGRALGFTEPVKQSSSFKTIPAGSAPLDMTNSQLMTKHEDEAINLANSGSKKGKY